MDGTGAFCWMLLDLAGPAYFRSKTTNHPCCRFPRASYCRISWLESSEVQKHTWEPYCILWHQQHWTNYNVTSSVYWQRLLLNDLQSKHSKLPLLPNSRTACLGSLQLAKVMS